MLAEQPRKSKSAKRLRQPIFGPPPWRTQPTPDFPAGAVKWLRRFDAAQFIGKICLVDTHPLVECASPACGSLIALRETTAQGLKHSRRTFRRWPARQADDGNPF